MATETGPDLSGFVADNSVDGDFSKIFPDELWRAITRRMISAAVGLLLTPMRLYFGSDFGTAEGHWPRRVFFVPRKQRQQES